MCRCLPTDQLDGQLVEVDVSICGDVNQVALPTPNFRHQSVDTGHETWRCLGRSSRCQFLQTENLTFEFVLREMSRTELEMSLPITWFNLRILGDIALYSLRFIQQAISVGKSIRPAITGFANNTGNEIYAIVYPETRRQRYVSASILVVKATAVVGLIFTYRRVSALISDANRETHDLVRALMEALKQ